MKKFIILLLLTVSFVSLSAVPQAVVFDYGDVLAFHNSKIVAQFLCQTFQLTQEELDNAKHEKKIWRIG